MLGRGVDLGVSAAFIYLDLLLTQMRQELLHKSCLTLAVNQIDLHLIQLADMGGAVGHEVLAHQKIIDAVADERKIQRRN